MIESSRKIFVVGIGGIGVSALARILRGRGWDVSGSDISQSEVTEELTAAGISVKVPHAAENLPIDCDLLIYSNAVPETNPERAEAARRKIPTLSYPEALGDLLRDYEKIIAVAGTNGKTTTTAMIGWILEHAGLDPTVLVGSKVLAWGSNARLGGKKYFVLEADEYRRAFLHYPADVAVITNIEADHLDYYRDIEDIRSAFFDFLGFLKPGGLLVYNSGNGNAVTVASLHEGNKKAFGEGNFQLAIPGRFNQENAAAAGVVAGALGVSLTSVAEALGRFTGTWRRFERVGRLGECEIVSDYAHHPDGIRVTLEAAASFFPGKRILSIFQPHQHNRTKRLFEAFVDAFSRCTLQDFVIAEIFDVAGREESVDQDVSSRDLVREIKNAGKNVEYARDLEEVEKIAREKSSSYDMIIFMGAGDIYKAADNLVKN